MSLHQLPDDAERQGDEVDEPDDDGDAADDVAHTLSGVAACVVVVALPVLAHLTSGELDVFERGVHDGSPFVRYLASCVKLGEIPLFL